MGIGTVKHHLSRTVNISVWYILDCTEYIQIIIISGVGILIVCSKLFYVVTICYSWVININARSNGDDAVSINAFGNTHDFIKRCTAINAQRHAVGVNSICTVLNFQIQGIIVAVQLAAGSQQKAADFAAGRSPCKAVSGYKPDAGVVHVPVSAALIDQTAKPTGPTIKIAVLHRHTFDICGISHPFPAQNTAGFCAAYGVDRHAFRCKTIDVEYV